MTLLLSLYLAFAPQAAQDKDLAPWEAEIKKLEDKLKSAPKNAVLFAGSSSIRLWNTAKAFAETPTVNVGFGGSEIRHSTAFAERIIFPHSPKSIFFYAGDNDLAKGRTPQQVQEDFKQFVKAIHAKLPETKVYFIAIKPSPKRWSLYDKQKEANKLVKEFCEQNKLLKYVDVVKPMLNKDGKPDPELFVKDELHLSEKGYAIWKTLIASDVK